MKQEFLIVLRRLRLGVLSVSEPAVSKVVTTWVCMLDKVFENTLVRWPSKGELARKVPRCLKKYPKARVIIDATPPTLWKFQIKGFSVPPTLLEFSGPLTPIPWN